MIPLSWYLILAALCSASVCSEFCLGGMRCDPSWH